MNSRITSAGDLELEAALGALTAAGISYTLVDQATLVDPCPACAFAVAA